MDRVHALQHFIQKMSKHIYGYIITTIIINTTTIIIIFVIVVNIVIVINIAYLPRLA